MLRRYLYAQYSEPMDFTGKDLLSLTDAPKDTVKILIPFLRDTPAMKRRWAFTRKLQTFNTAEIADEVHEFLNATQGESRLTRILLKNGRVIELCINFSQ
jgi:hypothetical protein